VTQTASAPAEERQDNWFDRHHFLLRRLHSLTGIVPVGVYVIVHMFTNFQMVFGGEVFQHEVDFIHQLPALLALEITIWVSLGFHGILGLFYTFTGRANVRHYQYWANWRYTLQRITGLIALAFIFFHVATLRWRWDFFGWYTPFYGTGESAPGLGQALAEVPLAMPLTAYSLQFHWAVAALYIIGVLAVIYHWSDGLWTAAITWGITLSQNAMRRWGYVCTGMFVLLLIFSIGAFWGGLTYDFQRDATPRQQKALLQILKDPPASLQQQGPAPAGTGSEVTTDG